MRAGDQWHLSTPLQLLCSLFRQPFVKRFALCYRSVVCPVCLSVTLVYCGQAVGTIKMKLGVQVGIGPGHIALDGDLAPPSPKGHSPPPIFGPYLLWPKGCMDQDATWHGGRPRRRRLCVRWGPCTRCVTALRAGDVSWVYMSGAVTVKPRLHDTTCCQTGLTWCQTACQTGCLFTRYSRLSNRL